MRRRVDVDESLDPVALPREVLSDLCVHALETLPEECCGLILSAGEVRYGSLVRCRNDMTRRHRNEPAVYPRDGTQAFWMNELDYMRAQDEAESLGERITGVYHSHVDAGAYLSELDLEYAEHELFPFPEADHLVVPVIDRKVGELALFRRADGQGFVGRRVVPAGSA